MHDPVGVALPLLGYQLVTYLLYSSQPSSRRRQKKQSEQLPEAKLVGSHRPDGVTFIVIVTSEVRRDNIKRKTQNIFSWGLLTLL